MSLSDHSICESTYGEFFEHIFSLKINVSSDVQNNAFTYMFNDSYVVTSSNLISNEHENKLRRSKRHRTEIRFGRDFITTFLTENFDMNFLNNELISIS